MFCTTSLLMRKIKFFAGGNTISLNWGSKLNVPYNQKNCKYSPVKIILSLWIIPKQVTSQIWLMRYCLATPVLGHDHQEQYCPTEL